MTPTGNFVPHMNTGQAGHPSFWDPSYSDVGQHASQSRPYVFSFQPPTFGLTNTQVSDKSPIWKL